MTGASKILTVSYGTFSCTLEGFDDPFNTMKAIAEYFRDLAAEDRYFGAEPPQPDAAMLHRIAEREIQRRVEAKIGAHGVVLRAEGDGAGLAPAAPQETANASPRPAVALAAPSVTEDDDGAVTASVAEKLSRLRMAAAGAALPPMPAPDGAADVPTDAAEAEALAPPAQALPAEATAREDVAEAAGEAFPATFTAEVPEAELELEGIRAALSLDLPTVAPAEPVLSEDVPAAQDTATLPVDVEPEDVATTLPPDVAEADLSVAGTDASESSLPASPAAEAVAAPEPEGVSEPASTPEPEPAPEPVPPPEPRLAKRPVRVIRPLAGAAQAPVASAAPAAPVAIPAPATPPIPTGPEAGDKAERARARVIRIRRNPAAPAAGEGSLSAEAEAALRAELDALTQTAPAAQEAPPPRPAAPTEPPARLGSAAEEAVERLMQEAASQMEGPESRRRQSAIAHLKAAVAATLAERGGVSPRKDEGQRTQPYRTALAEVVKPADPTSVSARPAPLVLVSAQRIDRPAAHPVAASLPAPQPMAVEQADPAEDEQPMILRAEQASSFADFAEKVGARTLAETIEAAAAYIATVEGRDSFTRPHLLGYVAANRGEVQREDSLRSFGVLLREGRLQKSRRGQFAINAASPLLAEARRIAG